MSFDIIIIGGGIMGATAALDLAEAGLSVALLERSGLASGATGANAGTLSLQIKRVSLMPYAMMGARLWSEMSARLGHDVHHRQPGGLNTALNEAEAEALRAAMAPRIEGGLPIDWLDGAAARAFEPALGPNVALASFCPLDGYASANLTGRAFRDALMSAGVALHEFTPAEAIDIGDGRVTVTSGSQRFEGRRLLITAGAWARGLLNMAGYEAPIEWRVNQMSVTERMPRMLSHNIGHVSGLMSLKQADNGTILIGGGWQGVGAPGTAGHVKDDNLRLNLRFAEATVPGLREARLVRSWYAYDAVVPDVMPLAGALPGHDHVFMLGCVRGGFTIGPAMGRLMAQHILGQEPELSLSGFSPERYVVPRNERIGA